MLIAEQPINNFTQIISQRESKSKDASQWCQHYASARWSLGHTEREKHFNEKNLWRQTSICPKSNTNCDYTSRKGTTQQYQKQYCSASSGCRLIWQHMYCHSSKREKEGTKAYFGGVLGYWPELETRLVVVGSIISIKGGKRKQLVYELYMEDKHQMRESTVLGTQHTRANLGSPKECAWKLPEVCKSGCAVYFFLKEIVSWVKLDSQ